MLIKLLSNENDYVKSLKQRRVYFLAMLCVGLVGFVCYFLLVPGSSLSSYAQGFYLGAATGLVAGSLILLVRTQRLISRPEEQKQAKIKDTDERELHITRQAAQTAGIFTFFAAAAALFIILPVSMEAYYALLGVMVLYMAAFVAARFWLSHKL